MLRGEYGDSGTFVLRWFTEISHVDHPRTTRNDRDSFVRTDSSCGSHFRSLLCQFLFRFVPFFSSSLLEYFEGASANLLMQRRCNFVLDWCRS
jgi:hypothetical protein